MSKLASSSLKLRFISPTCRLSTKVLVLISILGLSFHLTGFPTGFSVQTALASNEDSDVSGKEPVSTFILPLESAFTEPPQDRCLTAPPVGWGARKIGADSVWAAGVKGSGAVVAVISTGVRYTHVDLASHLWTNDDEIPENGVDDDSNGFVDDYIGYDFVGDDPDPSDDDGHGTSVAGLVLGDGSGGFTTGIAPEAELMSLKACASGNCFLPEVMQAMWYACSEGADVICIPLAWRGSGSDPNTLRWLCRNIADLGAIIVSMAVDGGTIPLELLPGAIPPPWLHPDQTLRGESAGVIAVAATDSFDLYPGNQIGPAEWSDFPYVPGDHDSIGLIKPDLAAPGHLLTTLDYRNDTAYVVAGSPGSGAPAAAGAAALLRSLDPSFTPAEIDSFLEMTAVDLGQPGKDNFYGAGRVDVWAAYQYCPPGVQEERGRESHDRSIETVKLDCSPNPSFGPLMISYGSRSGQPIKIRIYDLGGRMSREILTTSPATGQGTAQWDGRDSAGRDLTSGIYFVRLSAGDQRLSRKIVLIR